jgi:N,N'-diacetyllegionaminate synthase
MQVYNILEVANCHGGNVDYLKKLVFDFERIEYVGMKFQPFKYDKIANNDYSYYSTYKELYINSETWSSIFDLANKTNKDIWLDLFDLYGVEILTQNLQRICGIKLQASVLYNQELLKALSQVNLQSIKLLVNVSGYNLSDIRLLIKDFSSLFSVNEIIMQVGFQSYPTSVMDSGLAKLPLLRNAFPNLRFSIADHISSESESAIFLPILAATQGFEIIEKHIRLEAETKFDHQSSLTIHQYEKYLTALKEFSSAVNADFIPKKESVYLQKSLQVPFLNKNVKPGTLIKREDLSFKRTDKAGLNYLELSDLISNFSVLRDTLSKGDVIRSENMRRARIGAIIACRMKSQRLPKKATEVIYGDLSSVELCIKNTLKFANVDSVILATSTVEEDSTLSKFTYHQDVRFFRGNPDDVIERFIKVADEECLDVVIRQTGDNIFISNEILKILLDSHFLKGADYTTARSAALGTNLEIINIGALKEVKKYFPEANYSEYMTWYFQNNPEYFDLNLVDLPSSLIRDYRLTLDYEEDLQMFKKLIEVTGKGLEFNIYQIFETLDNNPEIAKINQHCTVKYQTDPKLVETLNTYTKIKQ